MEKKKSNWNQATLLTGDGIKYSRKGIYNCQNHIRLQKAKYMKHFMCPIFQFTPKMGHRRPTWNLEFFESCRVSQGRLKYAVEPKMLFLVKLNPEFSTSLTIRKGQSNFSIVFIFLSFEKKGIVVSFRWAR